MTQVDGITEILEQKDKITNNVCGKTDFGFILFNNVTKYKSLWRTSA
jgi:hypothetical protein